VVLLEPDGDYMEGVAIAEKLRSRVLVVGRRKYHLPEVAQVTIDTSHRLIPDAALPHVLGFLDRRYSSP